MVLKQLREPYYCMQFDPYRLLPDLARLIQESTGIPSFELTGEIPIGLSDDVLFKFAQERNWLPYEISVFDYSRPFYAVWGFHDEKYLLIEAESTALLVYEDGHPVGDSSILSALGDEDENQPINNLVGSLGQLSDQPILLRQLFDLPETGIRYYDAYTPIAFETYMPAIDHHFHTLNSLLKEPFYELHPIRPDQIKQVFENPTVKIA